MVRAADCRAGRIARSAPVGSPHAANLGRLNGRNTEDVVTCFASELAARQEKSMTTRTSRKTVTFKMPFSLEGIDHSLPAGSYEVITDEELVEGLSFPVYRRIATMMLVPGQLSRSVEMVTVDPLALAEALEREPSAEEAGARAPKTQ